MNIWICDDEKSTCAELENIILKYASERKLKFQVEPFYGGNTLIDHLNKNENPDILFLDIEIPVYNGVVVGDYIRKTLGNDSTFIVYISSKEQYAMQLFQNRPFDFLVKPLQERKVFEVLDSIGRIVYTGKESFVYHNGGILYRIPYREILYFESKGRKINIITNQEVKTFYGKMAEIEKTVPEYLFLNIHKSYLVNFNYVEAYAYEWVRMTNGDILNISRSNRGAVRKKVLEREMHEYGNR